MRSSVKVKRGDVGVVFADTLTADGEPIDLSEADGVLFVLRPKSGAQEAFSAAAEITEETAGQVAYTTVAGDLDVAGFYRQEWEITFSSGARFTVPSDGWNDVQVVDDLNPEDDVS